MKAESGWHGGDTALTRDGWQVTSDGRQDSAIGDARLKREDVWKAQLDSFLLQSVSILADEINGLLS